MQQQSPPLSSRSYTGLIGPAGCRVTSINGEPHDVGRPLRLPSGAMVHISEDGVWWYETGTAFDTLSADQVSIDSVQYEFEYEGLTQQASLEITIRGVQRSSTLREEQPAEPEASDRRWPVAEPYRLLVYTPTLSSIEIDPRAYLAETDRPGPAVTLILEDSQDGKTHVTDEGLLRFTPSAGFTGSTTVTCMVEGPHKSADTVEVMIEVVAPVLITDSNLSRSDVADASSPTPRSMPPSASASRCYNFTPATSDALVDGEARPRSRLNILIRESSGRIHSEAVTVADPSGYWSARLRGLLPGEEYELEFSDQSGASIQYGYLSVNLHQQAAQSVR